MPVPTDFAAPEDVVMGAMTPGIYESEITDITYEEKESSFKDEKTGEPKVSKRFTVQFKVVEGPSTGSQFRAWLNANLRPPKEPTKPSLAKLLKVVTGEEWPTTRQAELTGTFMNTLIGAKLKVVTDVQKKKDGSGEYTLPTQFMK